MYLIQQSTLRLENVKINDSYSRMIGTISVESNSELFISDSAISGRSPKVGGIGCEITSRVHLESVALISYSSSIQFGCVYSWKCNVTMDNITFMDTDYAITVHESTLDIFNSLALNDTIKFLTADSSHVTFWNMNISGAHIVLGESIAEFQHTIFMNLDPHCLIEDHFRSNITLKSVYIPHSANMSSSIVCKGSGTVIYGNTSGKTVRLSKRSQ